MRCHSSGWIASPLRSEAGEPAAHDADAAEGDRDSYGHQETLLPADGCVCADPKRIGQNGHQRDENTERDGGVTGAFRAQLSRRVSSLVSRNGSIKVDRKRSGARQQPVRHTRSGHRGFFPSRGEWGFLRLDEAFTPGRSYSPGGVCQDPVASATRLSTK